MCEYARKFKESGSRAVSTLKRPKKLHKLVMGSEEESDELLRLDKAINDMSLDLDNKRKTRDEIIASRKKQTSHDVKELLLEEYKNKGIKLKHAQLTEVAKSLNIDLGKKRLKKAEINFLIQSHLAEISKETHDKIMKVISNIDSTKKLKRTDYLKVAQELKLNLPKGYIKVADLKYLIREHLKQHLSEEIFDLRPDWIK